MGVLARTGMRMHEMRAEPISGNYYIICELRRGNLNARVTLAKIFLYRGMMWFYKTGLVFCIKQEKQNNRCQRQFQPWSQDRSNFGTAHHA